MVRYNDCYVSGEKCKDGFYNCFNAVMVRYNPIILLGRFIGVW